MQSSEDWQAWKWVVGAIGSMLGGAAVGGWVGRGLVEEIKQNVTAQGLRLDTVEAEQRKCQAYLKKEIKEIVQQALAQQSLAHVEQMGAIRTELAVITALHGETQFDVKAIFDRLDRRQTDAAPPVSGERRDQS